MEMLVHCHVASTPGLISALGHTICHPARNVRKGLMLGMGWNLSRTEVAFEPQHSWCYHSWCYEEAAARACSGQAVQRGPPAQDYFFSPIPDVVEELKEQNCGISREAISETMGKTKSSPSSLEAEGPQVQSPSGMRLCHQEWKSIHSTSTLRRKQMDDQHSASPSVDEPTRLSC